MCDWKPGDEIVCVKADHTLKSSHSYPADLPQLVKGEIYTVRAVGEVFDGWGQSEGIGVWLNEVSWVSLSGRDGCFEPTRFRKVERKSDSLSIEAFLTIKPGFEEPRRTNQPAKRKEQA